MHIPVLHTDNLKLSKIVAADTIFKPNEIVFRPIEALEILDRIFQNYADNDCKPKIGQNSLVEALGNTALMIADFNNIKMGVKGSAQYIKGLAKTYFPVDKKDIIGEAHQTIAEAQVNALNECAQRVCNSFAENGIISKRTFAKILNDCLNKSYNYQPDSALPSFLGSYSTFTFHEDQKVFIKGSFIDASRGITTTYADLGGNNQNNGILDKPSSKAKFGAILQIAEKYLKPLDALNILSKTFSDVVRNHSTHFTNEGEIAHLKIYKELVDKVIESFNKYKGSNESAVVNNFKNDVKAIFNDSSENTKNAFSGFHETLEKTILSIANNGLISENKLFNAFVNIEKIYSSDIHFLSDQRDSFKFTLENNCKGKLHNYTSLPFNGNSR